MSGRKRPTTEEACKALVRAYFLGEFNDARSGGVWVRKDGRRAEEWRTAERVSV